MNVGDRVGKLTILKKEKRNSRFYFYCRCDCGNEKWIRTDALTKKNPTKSCGCDKSKFDKVDLTGKKYGMLTVLEYTGEGKYHEEIWLCKCECGNIIRRKRNSLVNNRNCNCGCYTKEITLDHVKKANEKLNEVDRIEGTSINKISREKPLKSNKSGYNGVSWDKSRKKWVAQIWFKNKHYYLGRYDVKEEAIKVRKEAEEKIFGEFLKWYEKNYKK